jgi:hypothetical protein
MAAIMEEEDRIKRVRGQGTVIGKLVVGRAQMRTRNSRDPNRATTAGVEGHRIQVLVRRMVLEALNHSFKSTLKSANGVKTICVLVRQINPERITDRPDPAVSCAVVLRQAAGWSKVLPGRI